MSKRKIECVNCATNPVLESLADRLVVKDKVAIIPGLDEIMDQVVKLRLPSRSQAADELLRRVKERYQVPKDEEREYRIALIDHYDRRLTDYG